MPIHSWSVEQVWWRILQAGTRHHPAYDLGMPRSSCCFCVMAPKNALLLAAKHNRELFEEYCRVEAKIGHTFRHNFALASLWPELEAGGLIRVQDWKM